VPRGGFTGKSKYGFWIARFPASKGDVWID
jgi:hypothetical protein